jgi:hypothetical protein
LALVLSSCGAASSTAGPSPSSAAALSVPQLKYAVIDHVGKPDFCDPDFYPVARVGGEQSNADAQYATIKADSELYSAIVAHEHLPSGDLDAGGRLTVYRAFKELRALVLSPSSDQGYSFKYTVTLATAGTVAQYQIKGGTVTADGKVTVQSRTSTGPPMCPICLAANTLIDTPSGPLRVTRLQVGMLVWTTDAAGQRVAEPLLETGSIDVGTGHLMVHLKLADGRELYASPGHPTANGTPLAALAVGSMLDGSVVTAWELVPYSDNRTYDILPAGPTGKYWANGILMRSTLALEGPGD